MTVTKLIHALLDLPESLQEREVTFFDGSHLEYMEIAGVKLMKSGRIEIEGKLCP